MHTHLKRKQFSPKLICWDQPTLHDKHREGWETNLSHAVGMFGQERAPKVEMMHKLLCLSTVGG